MASIYKNADAKYEALITSLSDGIIIVNQAMNITTINPALTTLLGYDSSDLLGKNVRNVIHITQIDGRPLPSLRKEVERLYKTTSFLTDTNIWKRKDGQKLIIKSLTSPYRIDGGIAGAIIVVRDISEQSAIDNAKTEFVSLAAHQLRTPLSSVNWYIEMLSNDKKGQLNEKQKDYLAEVKIANEKMVMLVNDLLNVSRIDLGTFVIKPKPTDLQKVIDSVTKELSSQIQEKSLHITTAFTGAINNYRIDPKLAIIVFQNLIGNAVKYTPEGGSIDIYAILDSQKLLITIDDTGYGIPNSQQKKVFTKLFRADNVLKRDTEGTGLGLYLVKAIVERAGGSIEFSSKVNRGTTFSVTFPSRGMKRQLGGHELASSIPQHQTAI